MATVPDLATAIDGVQDAAKRVIVDLSESTFLDSAAINCLIRYQRQLDQRGVSFGVVSPVDGVVRRALEITNVIDRLGVVDSRAEAVT